MGTGTAGGLRKSPSLPAGVPVAPAARAAARSAVHPGGGRGTTRESESDRHSSSWKTHRHAPLAIFGTASSSAFLAMTWSTWPWDLQVQALRVRQQGHRGPPRSLRTGGT